MSGLCFKKISSANLVIRDTLYTIRKCLCCSSISNKCSLSLSPSLSLSYIGKTKAITFGRRVYLNNIAMFPSLLLYGNVIDFSDSVKNLGVELDQTLSWRDNVVSISNNVFQSLYQFKLPSHLSNSRSEPALKTRSHIPV